MNTIGLIFGIITSVMLSNCKAQTPENEFIFVKDYCATVVVGGVLGIQKKCFAKMEVVQAETVTDSSIVIRIAEKSERNVIPGPSSYQELLVVPKEYVEQHQ